MTDIYAAAISAAVALIVGLLVNFQGRKQLFSNTVSKERMVWIKEVRALCVDLCVLCEQYDRLTPDQETAFLKAREGILLHLDPKGHYITDDALIELLQDKSFEDVKKNIGKVRETLRRVFKSEWDKVKIEAGNRLWRVWRINWMQKHLKTKK